VDKIEIWDIKNGDINTNLVSKNGTVCKVEKKNGNIEINLKR